MVTRSISLRHGDARDVATLDMLMAAAFDPRFGEAWTRNQCLGVLALPGVRLTLAHVDDRAVGFALTRTVLDEAELLLLAVIPDERRSGIGGALLRAVLADLGMANVVTIHLEVRENNPAIRLYQRHQFERVGVRAGYYRGRSGELFDAHTYRRPIP